MDRSDAVYGFMFAGFFSGREANHWYYISGGGDCGLNDVFRICHMNIVDNVWYIVTMFGNLLLTVGTV